MWNCPTRRPRGKLMREFTKIGEEYYIDEDPILFNLFLVRAKGQDDKIDPASWGTKASILKILADDNWWEVKILAASPLETMGALTIIHNREIRPYSLAPDWQLHRYYTERDSEGKMKEFESGTFDTAQDREHMILVAKERFEDIIRGKEFLN
jgi:hypothetical protein